MKDRVRAVQEFLKGGGSICPFARSYFDRTVFVPLPPGYSTHRVARPMLDFVQNPDTMALVYVYHQDMPTHAQARRQSNDLFKMLYFELILDEHGSEVRSSRREIMKFADSHLAPDSPTNPLLTHKGNGFFIIAMNPLYGEGHPRYAPHSFAFVTRQGDVDQVPRPVAFRIRETSWQAYGASYNGDQLYLPSRPTTSL